jgi:hypothetical protein
MIKKYFPDALLGSKYHQLISNCSYFQKKTLKIKFLFLFEPQFTRGTPWDTLNPPSEIAESVALSV